MEADARKAQIKEILKRGNIVVFTCEKLVKKINCWQQDKDTGDLVCFYTNGLSNRVCWEAPSYTVTEEVSTLSA